MFCVVIPCLLFKEGSEDVVLITKTICPYSLRENN
jgi:hypothetical protein